jgi:hypothetical protein
MLSVLNVIGLENLIHHNLLPEEKWAVWNVGKPTTYDKSSENVLKESALSALA